MSHPQGFIEGSKQYQSSLSKCIHAVMRIWQDPQGKSSVCEICNSQKMRPYSPQKLKTIKRKTGKPVRSVQNEVFEEQDDPQEFYAETNVTKKNYSEAQGIAAKSDFEEVLAD